MKMKKYLSAKLFKGLIGFNKEQIEVIMRGMDRGVDLLKYVDKRYSAEKMEHILCAILDDIDFKILLNPRMSSEKMKRLRFSMTERIDLIGDSPKPKMGKIIHLS